jgi:hypothetical protein
MGTDTHQIPLRQVSEVQASTGLIGNTLQVDGNKFSISSSETCRDFESTINDLLQGRSVQVQQPQSVSSESSASSDEEPENRPWYDSNGLVVLATLLLFPLGIWGFIQRRSLSETGVTNFYDHSVALWLMACHPMSAPFALYGFWKRRTEGPDGSTGELGGLSLAGIMSILMAAAFISAATTISGLESEQMDSESDVWANESDSASTSGDDEDKERESSTTENEAANGRENPREAWYVCQEAVREDIHQPSTAEFAPITQVKGGPGVSKDGNWAVTGWVTAQNKAGGQTRGQATCELEWTGSGFDVIRAGIQR